MKDKRRCMYLLRRKQIYPASCGGFYVSNQTTMGDEDVDSEEQIAQQYRRSAQR